MKKAQIEIPEGFEARREGTGLFVYRGEESFGIAPIARPMWKAVLERTPSFPDTVQTEFAAGAFSGYKVSREGIVRSYMLKGQGKYVMVSVSCDAKLLERLLTTLHFADG